MRITYYGESLQINRALTWIIIFQGYDINMRIQLHAKRYDEQIIVMVECDGVV
jgi:hypothetical protein